MLFKQRFWEPMREGRVTVAFRRWAQPRAKVGARHRVPVGVIEIESVTVVDDPAAIAGADVRKAGFASLDELLRELGTRDGDVHRIQFRYVGPDEREALRADDTLSATDVEAISARLARLDRASPRGPWTMAVLELIGRRPAELAADLASEIGFEKAPFKQNVRKLKALGLTESLQRGYRLSPRGLTYVAAIRQEPGGRPGTP